MNNYTQNKNEQLYVYATIVYKEHYNLYQRTKYFQVVVSNIFYCSCNKTPTRLLASAEVMKNIDLSTYISKSSVANLNSVQ